MKDSCLSTHISKYMIHETNTQKYQCSLVKDNLTTIKKKINTLNTEVRNTQANNLWLWPMKGPKALGTILVNSSTNSNQKPRHLTGNLKGT